MYDRWDALAGAISDSDEEDVVLKRRAEHEAARRLIRECDGGVGEFRFGIGQRAREEKVCSLTKYSWTDEPAAVVIQVNLPKRSGISIVASDFRAQSFNVELVDSNTQRYRFAIAELLMEIVPQKCECFIDERARLVCKITKFGKVPWQTLAHV